jgi:hypothetical protein
MGTAAVSPLRQRIIEDMNARKLCAGTQSGHTRGQVRVADGCGINRNLLRDSHEMQNAGA